MKKNNEPIFGRRAVSAFIALVAIIGILPVRLLEINIKSYASAATDSGGKVIQLSQSRGVLYDRNMNRLVCDTTGYSSAIKPTADSLTVLKQTLDAKQFEAASQELSVGNPLVMQLGNTLSCDDILTIPIYKRYNSSRLACHLIGYLNGEGTGVSGLEKSYNEYLESHSGSLSVRFSIDAMGRVLSGDNIEIIDENYNRGAGVVLTIDKKYQTAVESAMDACGLKTGAAVMLEVSSGAIVALASRPTFDSDNVGESINDEKLPLFNRALAAYPVGSVFKLLVAAAALEQGIDPSTTFFCDGSVRSGGVDFGCLKAHGSVNLPQALAYSCNCYYINLIEQLDVSAVTGLAESIGFGCPNALASGITSAAGNVTALSALTSAAARANFSFGQGSLTATPLQIASLYATVAAGGNYYVPHLVEAFCGGDGLHEQVYQKKPPFKLISQKNAATLCTFLELAVREGTGKAAQVEGVSVAGKTATAQSGEYVNGRERLVSWFAGFYPAEKPEYVLVVMCDDGSSGSKDCAPVFSKAVGAIVNS